MMILAMPSLMNDGRRRMLMNPPGATVVLSIIGLAGRAARMAFAAVVGFKGAPAEPWGCGRKQKKELAV